MDNTACGRVLDAANKAVKGGAMARHLAAIESGNVTKTNVIGLRKAINHIGRINAGWSGNRCKATAAEVSHALERLEAVKPLVRGELHESGVRLVNSPRYRKRLERVAETVEFLQEFRLVGYEAIRAHHWTPIYRAVSVNGGWFEFYNLSWQSAAAFGEESGPVILRAWHNV